ncbi:POTRA domain-containing protein, partial [Enterobacter hormaechei]|uniref:POTRA domain-containing protein n=1 Tax=Enterobacter hormaechei TaxID=158836 RepID=UPI0023EE527D
MKHHFLFSLTGLVVLSMARADTLPSIIKPDNPAQVSRNVAPEQTEAAPQPNVKIEKPKSTLTPETPITIHHIQFIGGTRYPLKELLQPFRPYAGKTVPLKTLTGLVNDITERYKA